MRAATVAWCLLAAALAAPAPYAPLAALEGPGALPPAPWRVAGLPKHEPTRFALVELDGVRALRVEAERSYGHLVHDFDPPAAPRPMAWSWRVEQRNERSELRQRWGDDTTLKVCALFDMPDERVPFVERQLLRVARLHTHEPLPAATVCYVWDAHLAAGTVLDNAFSRRVRYVVLEGRAAPLNRWIDERRDLAADFRELFGEESAEVPPLRAIAVGADADNTKGRSVGYVRALRWAP